ncbi:MAG: hypothetical protein WB816_15245 [Methylocystis sp.]
MDISLEQAIHMHARALKGRAGKKSPMLARLRAGDLKDRGDLEGFRVWTLVGQQAELLLAAQSRDEVDVREMELREPEYGH